MWVQLALPSNPNEVRSIQTLISSKASGCEVDGSHNGIALFANAWNTNSGQLFLSWGNSHSGCEELATREQVLTPGRWHFVAATRDTAGHAALYVDGELLASTDETQGFSDATKGARMRVVGGTAPIAIDAWRSHPLRFGAHVVAEHGSPADNLHYLRGYLANIAVHTVALSESQQRRLICGVYESIWGIGGIGGMPAPLLLLRPPKGHTTVDTGAFDPLSRPAGGFVLVSPGESGVDHEKHPPPFITSAKKPKDLGLSLHELERRKQEEIHRKLEEERQKELAAEAAQAAEAAAGGGGGGGGNGGGDGGGGLVGGCGPDTALQAGARGRRGRRHVEQQPRQGRLANPMVARTPSEAIRRCGRQRLRRACLQATRGGARRDATRMVFVPKVRLGCGRAQAGLQPLARVATPGRDAR